MAKEKLITRTIRITTVEAVFHGHGDRRGSQGRY